MKLNVVILEENDKKLAHETMSIAINIEFLILNMFISPNEN